MEILMLMADCSERLPKFTYCTVASGSPTVTSPTLVVTDPSWDGLLLLTMVRQGAVYITTHHGPPIAEIRGQQWSSEGQSS